jgi:formylglycine-generating enzyme required for sulfatase activity
MDSNDDHADKPLSAAQQIIAGDLVHGDQVTGDKIGGDKFGDVSGSYNAIGAGAQVNIFQTAPAVAEKPRLPVEPDTVLIPAGPFLMGNDDDTLAAPQTQVDLSAYRISLYPITNEQFAQFIRQTNRVASSEMLWEGNRPPHDRLRHPVMGVTWQEAVAFCQWLTDLTERPYILPSEAQWEKAARGVDGRLYPWGNEWDPACCNSDWEEITAVDAFPPQSDFGCYDMVGNAREWTTTLWGDAPREPADYYRYPWTEDGRDNLDAPLTTRRIYRGGRGDGPTAYRCSRRNAYLPTRAGPRQQRHGFRVVLLRTET